MRSGSRKHVPPEAICSARLVWVPVDASQARVIIPGMRSTRSGGDDENDVAAPLFGTWRKAYLAVVVVFLFDVAFFYAISRFFA